MSALETKAPKAHLINVLPEPVRIRQNSATYTPATDCATLLHEVLHLLGLVDEYKEAATEIPDPVTGKNRPVDFQCRPLGPPDSIMSSHFSAVWNLPTSGGSILKPAHYRFIMYPNCK